MSKERLEQFNKMMNNPVPLHYSEKGGHKARSNYWKNIKAIKSAEDEAWEFAEKMNQLRVVNNDNSVVNKVVK